MKFRKYKMSSLNEALLKTPVTACDDDDLEVVVAADPTYADALSQSIKAQKAQDDRFKDFDANMKEFAKDNQNREKEGNAKMEVKKLHLSESLFEDVKVVSPAVEEEDIVVKTTEPKSETLTEAAEEVIVSCRYEVYDRGGPIQIKKRRAKGPDLRSALLKLISKMMTYIDVDEAEEDPDTYTTEYILDNLSESNGDGCDFIMELKNDTTGEVLISEEDPFENDWEMDEDVDPHFFQDDGELVEAPVAVEEPKKKRTRGNNEKKELRDYSSEDLWLAVYDELCATVDNEGEGQQVYKQVKARKGERYEHVYPHGDTDLIVYAQNPEQFDFAKKVCDHYDVTYDEPKEDTNKSTNGYYKYSMIIHIPEDGLYSED